MKEFPGKVEKRGRRLALDEEQSKWLRKWFPVTENYILEREMGISDETFRRFIKEMNLRKSAKGLEAIRKRSIKKAVEANERNGCYDRKRGHPVSAATLAGRLRRFEEERLGLKENAHSRIRREDPDRYREWMRKRSLERKESIRKEKLRILYGLERKTRIKAAVLYPYTRSQLHHRCNALKRGYCVAEDCSEGSPDRYVIYYDSETERSADFEKNLRKDGFAVREWV